MDGGVKTRTALAQDCDPSALSFISRKDLYIWFHLLSKIKRMTNRKLGELASCC